MFNLSTGRTTTFVGLAVGAKEGMTVGCIEAVGTMVGTEVGTAVGTEDGEGSIEGSAVGTADGEGSIVGTTDGEAAIFSQVKKDEEIVLVQTSSLAQHPIPLLEGQQEDPAGHNAHTLGRGS